MRPRAHWFGGALIAGVVTALMGLSLAAVPAPLTAAADTLPGPVDHLVVTTPTAVVGGSSFTFTVSAVDAKDTPVNGYSGTVRFSSDDVYASLPAASPAASGPFTATLRSVGLHTIKATDVATNSITGTSTGVQVLPHFVVSPPSTVASGTPFAFTVAAVDGGGNVVTDYAGTVGFTSSDTSATFSARGALPKGQGRIE